MSYVDSPLMTVDMGDGPFDLRLRNIEKHYDGFSLGPVSLDVPEGSVVGLIGQNGAGKTTLMRIAMEAVRPDAGEMELFGRSLSTLSMDEKLKLRENVAFVSAVTSYAQSMTVNDVITFYTLTYPSFDGNALAELLGRFELEQNKKKITELSRGMGMKLQIACALATGAKLLLMDEPTAGLDPIVREEVLAVLREWMERGDRTILISSHITSDLSRLADYIVMIDEGKTVLSCAQDSLDSLGIARLRSSSFERMVDEGAFGQGRTRAIRHALNVDVLVLDREDFLSKHPDEQCDRAGIDELMVLIVKGEVI
ncbi:MAG: ABC transporter ATP-binding protein [Atopobiaceae bacterium]|nr:ABC transporter ATP-binding protein [Atopobiaceae bacterium]